MSLSSSIPTGAPEQRDIYRLLQLQRQWGGWGGAEVIDPFSFRIKCLSYCSGSTPVVLASQRVKGMHLLTFMCLRKYI